MKRKNSLYFEGKIVYCFIKVRQKFIKKRGQRQKCVFLAGAKLCSTKNFSSFSFLSFSAQQIKSAIHSWFDSVDLTD